ncbi:integrase, catalytic region, zinc finger, CCHC-type containing protein [Tanacetum coccineum]
MENKENGRMILDSIQNGPLVWPTVVQEDGTTRKKTYAELSATEKLQADCDHKATNIVLQGLPSDVYAIVNHHNVAKEIWDRVKLLMQGTKLSLQENECKLYDEFDKFSFVKGETLYQYYWRFSQLNNNMNAINMSMRPVQVYTKFLNNLPPEWSKFVTDVKLARDLHTTNYDQLYSYIEQHEIHANETHLMRERYQDPLAFVANYLQSPSQLNNYHSQYIPTQFPQQAYMVPQVHPPQPYSPMYIPPRPSQPQICLAVPVFNQGDDPIACLNKAMAFLTVVAISRFPSTNNQLKTSSNPRNQATIQDGIVTMQQVQGKQGKSYAGNATSYGRNNAGRQARVVKCYNCQGEAQEAGQILDEEQLAFLADPSIPSSQAAQITIPNIAAFQTEDLDAYYSDCDDVSNAKKAQRIKPTLYDGSVISSQHVACPVIDDEDTLILEDESCVKYLDLDAELLNKQNVYNDLSKSYSQLEKHCISLELTMQLNQENFQKDSLSNNQNALEILEYFENNDLKAQLQAKDTTIYVPSSSSRFNDRLSKLSDGTVRFKNDQVAKIMGYGDFSRILFISRVYDNLEGVDLLSGSRDTNLYTISLDDMLKTSLIYLLSKASKTRSWLWHRRLSHLNFGTLNKLAKDGLARGIPKLKF